MKYYLQVLKKYAVFTGRASRQEFWMFFLVNFIIGIVLNIGDKLLGTTYSYYMPSGIPISIGYINSLYSLVVLIPNLAVSVRRLHDVNKSGKLLLLVFVPLLLIFWAAISGAYGLLILLFFVVLGLAIWMLVLQCMPGTNGPNKYGEDPYGGGFKFSFEEGGNTPDE